MNSYYLTSRSKRIYSITSLIALVVMISLFFYISRNIFCMQIYFLGLGLFSIYALFQKLKNEHVELTEKGIEYHAPGVIFETGWESIEQISNHWRYGFVHECLLVDNSRIRMRKWSFFLGGRNVPTPAFSSRKTLVPLSCFSENWRDSELGQQIKQYAPHLFEKEKSVQSA